MTKLTKVVIGLSLVASITTSALGVVVAVAPTKVQDCMKVEMLEAVATGDTTLSPTSIFWIRASKLNEILRRSL